MVYNSLARYYILVVLQILEDTSFTHMHIYLQLVAQGVLGGQRQETEGSLLQPSLADWHSPSVKAFRLLATNAICIQLASYVLYAVYTAIQLCIASTQCPFSDARLPKFHQVLYYVMSRHPLLTHPWSALALSNNQWPHCTARIIYLEVYRSAERRCTALPARWVCTERLSHTANSASISNI